MEKIMEAAIGRLEPGPLSDSALQGLRYILPDTLILGALTLIDRECVVRYTLENGRQHYVVQGSSAASYSVYPKLGASRPPFCSCYAFLHGVLSTRMHLLVGNDCNSLLKLMFAIEV